MGVKISRIHLIVFLIPNDVNLRAQLYTKDLKYDVNAKSYFFFIKR
jgi:hypothetical protein